MLGNVVRRSLDLLWTSWQGLAGVALAVGAANAIIGVAAGLTLDEIVDTIETGEPVAASTALAAGIGGLAVFGATVLFTSVLVAMVRDAAQQGRPDAGDALRTALGRLPSLVGVVVTSGVLVFVGLLVFIVPGVWVAVSLFPVVAVVLHEERGVVDSVRRSITLVWRAWLPVFGIVVIIAGINFGFGIVGTVPGPVGFALTVVANGLSAAILATAMWATYEELKRASDWPDLVR